MALDGPYQKIFMQSLEYICIILAHFFFNFILLSIQCGTENLLLLSFVVGILGSEIRIGVGSCCLLSRYDIIGILALCIISQYIKLRNDKSRFYYSCFSFIRVQRQSFTSHGMQKGTDRSNLSGENLNFFLNEKI